MLFHNIACVLARQGDPQRALEMVKAAIASGYDEWRTMKQDEDLASLRSDRSFVALFAPGEEKKSKRAPKVAKNPRRKIDGDGGAHAATSRRGRAVVAGRHG